MFIKNQQFKDEDTLLETLFDFEIGTPSPYMQGIVEHIATAMGNDAELAAHLQTLEEEDRLELQDEILREHVAKTLQNNFTSFTVSNAAFYGISGKDQVLLYSVDLY